MARDVRVTIFMGLKETVSRRLAILRGTFSGIATLAAKAFTGAAAGSLAAFTGILVKATHAAASFQEIMDQVSTLISDDMAPSFANASARVLELSKALPQTADELGIGLYDILSSGVEDSAGAFEVLEVAAKSAIAGGFGSTTQDAVRTITALLNAYQLEASEAGRISDILFETIRVGVVTFPDLAQNIGNLATSAALAGVSLEEVGAAIATMTKFGVNAAETTTSLNRLFLSLTNQTKEQAEGLKKLGIDFSIAAVKSRGLAAVLTEIQQKTGGNLDALSDLFPSIRELRAAMVIAGEKGAKVFSATLDQMNKSSGATDRAFGKLIHSLTNTWKLFKNNLNVVLIEFGNTLIPGLTRGLHEGIRQFRGFAQGVRENSTGLQRLGERLGDLVAGFVRGIPKMVRAFGNFFIAVQKGVDFFKRLGATSLQFGLVGLVFLGPAGALGLAAIGKSIDILLEKLFGPTTEKGIVQRDLKESTEEMMRLNRGAIELFQRFKRGETGIKDILADLRHELTFLTDFSKAGVKDRRQVVEDTLTLLEQLNEFGVISVDESLLDALEGRIQALGDRTEELHTVLEGLPKDFMSSALENIGEFLRNLADSMEKGAAEGGAAGLKKAVEDAGNEIEPIPLDWEIKPSLAPVEEPKITPLRDPIPVAFSIEQLDTQALESSLREVSAVAEQTGTSLGELLTMPGAGETFAVEVEALGVANFATDMDTVRAAAQMAGVELESLDDKDVEILVKSVRADQFEQTLQDVQAVADATGASLGELVDSGITDLKTALVLAGAQQGFDGILSSAEKLDMAMQGIIGLASGLTDAFASAFEAMITGSENAAAAFAGAMLTAIADVARTQAMQFFAEGLFMLARGIFGDPRGFAAAGQAFAAAALMSAVAGVAGGLASKMGGGGGGGGGGVGSDRSGRDLEGPESSGTIVIEGDPVLDMSSSRRRREFAEALGELYGRRTVIRTAR